MRLPFRNSYSVSESILPMPPTKFPSKFDINSLHVVIAPYQSGTVFAIL